MRKIFIILGIVTITVGISLIGFGVNVSSVLAELKEIYYCPMHPHYTSDHPGNCPICSMKLVKKEDPVQKSSSSPVASSEKKILYWTDTMIPGYKATGPGKSPMGMDLTPVYADDVSQDNSSSQVSGYANVAMNTQKQQLIGIKTTTVTKKTLVKTIHAYGFVAHDLELYEAQLEYIDAWQQFYAFVIRRPVIDGNYKEDWWKNYITQPSDGYWRNSDKLKAQQRLIKADYALTHFGLTDGEIGKLQKIKQGRPWIQPDLLFTDKNKSVWVYAQISESDLGFVDVGQKVKVTIPAYNESTEGIVRNVLIEVDPITRTTKVRIELPKYRGELKVNMYVSVDMPVELDEALLVPRQAIMDTGLNKIVFVATGQGHFEPRDIQTGFVGDGMVVVKSGLKEGETIVVDGNFLLDSESRIQASIAGGQ